jgi:hypothetical protein
MNKKGRKVRIKHRKAEQRTKRRIKAAKAAAKRG